MLPSLLLLLTCFLQLTTSLYFREMTSGCVCLLREIAAVDPERAIPFLGDLVGVARLDHFHHCHYLHEIIWSQLCNIASSVGKKAMKQHLEDVIPLLCRSVKGEHQLAAAAAGRCTAALSKLVGPSIFAGRCSDTQRETLSSFC